MKKVSIIVPIYNGEDYIVRCVNSLTNQTYKNTEIILVDDGSTDNSLDLCKKIASSDKRIFVYHKPNGGLSSARNFGLEKSTGDYIGFVDCDDYVDSKMYEDLIKLIIDKPSTDIACCNFVRVFENDKKDYSHCIFSSKHIQTSQGYFESLLLHKGDVSVCTKLFNRELLRGRRFDETKLNEDLLFIFSLNITNVYFTGNESYFYAFRTNSLSTSFGKAVLDMGPNSIFISNEIVSKYPELKEQAIRFSLFQNMCLLLKIPAKKRNKKYAPFKNALDYLRTFNSSSIKRNVYLTKKEKKYIFFLKKVPSLFLCIYHIFR